MSQSNHVEKFLKMVDALDEFDRSELSTFLKDSVAQLAASESRYRTLIETMTEGLVCLDPLMRITQVNQALCRMLEYSEEEILGRSYLDIIDKSQVSVSLDKFWRQLHGERSTYETCLVTRSGRKVSVIVGAAPFIDNQGRVQGTFGIYTDVSDQRRAEAEIRFQANLLANVNDCIIGIDLDGRIQSWNRGAEKLYGWSQEEAVGQQISLMFPLTELARLREILTTIKAGGTWRGQVETMNKAKTARPVWLSVTSIRDENGNIKGAVGIVADIAHLIESHRQAEAANRAKSEFLANMSHEIRTPLGGILGFAELLSRENLSPRLMEFVTTIQRCGQQLSHLVDNILDLSKIEADRIELQNANFEVSTLINECTAAIQPHLKDTAIVLKTFISPQVPPILSGDVGRISQVLTNLLGNAVKFTERGEIEVRASRGNKRLPSSQFPLHISVRDTGIGIPRHARDNIFQAFTQVDGSPARKYGGTGLGLAICRQLIELMGGRIWVDSEEGRGSTFHFCVPLEQPLSKVVKRNQPRSRPVPAASAGGSAFCSILVTEDNEANRRLITYILQAEGHSVRVAENGQQCLQILEQEEFDLLLMDMQMPILDGYETTKRIRQSSRWQNLPIIALTAHAMKGDAEKCLAAGCTDYLAKPFTRGQLLEALRRVQAGQQPKEAKVAGSDRVIQALLPEFLTSLDDMVKQIDQALTGGDLETVLSVSHDIKGSAGLYGLKDISQIGAEINQAIKQGRLEGLNRLIQQLRNKVQQIQQATNSKTTGDPHITNSYGK